MRKEIEPGSPDQPAVRQRTGIQRSVPWLWVMVIVLLFLNVGQLVVLNLVRMTAIETVGQVEVMLEDLSHEVVVYEVPIHQAVPVQAEVPINQTFDIPLDTLITLSQTMTVPVGGIDLELPVQTEVPVQAIVPITLNETIGVSTAVQLNTTVPVEVEVARTPLLAYLNQVRYELARLKGLLAFSTSPPSFAVIPSPPPSLSLAPTATTPPSPTTSPSPTLVEIEPTVTPSPATSPVAEETATPSTAPDSVEAVVMESSTPSSSPISTSVTPAEAAPAEVPPTATIVTEPEPQVVPMPLITYVTSVEILGREISKKAEPFQEVALRYGTNQATLDEFEAEFNRFKPEVEALIGQINQLSPPQEATAVHQKLIAGLAKCEAGLDMLTTWLETFDESLELPAMLQVTLCLEETGAAEAELRQLLPQ